MLRGLGLQLAGSLDVRHESDVHEHRVLAADLQRKFANGLKERQSLDVAGGAADLGNDHVRAALFADQPDAILDFIRHMRDHLHRLAEIIAAAFLLQHGLVDLPAGEVVEARERGVGEAFVMPEIEIRLCAVIQHIHFAVLERAHRAGIDIQVRIELLQRDFEAAALQQRAEGGGRESLAQGTYYSACQKNILHAFRSNASTRATSSGTSTPTASCSTRRTAMAMPFSSARNCSSRSASSSGEGSKPTNRAKVSRR